MQFCLIMLWMFKEPLHKSIIVYLNYNYHLTVAYGSTPVNLELFKIKKKNFHHLLHHSHIFWWKPCILVYLWKLTIRIFFKMYFWQYRFKPSLNAPLYFTFKNVQCWNYWSDRAFIMVSRQTFELSQFCHLTGLKCRTSCLVRTSSCVDPVISPHCTLPGHPPSHAAMATKNNSTQTQTHLYFLDALNPPHKGYREIRNQKAV